MNIEQLIKELDRSNATKAIKVNKVPLWPFLKVFFFDKLYVSGGTRVSLSIVQRLKFVKSIFYGFFNWFGKVDYLVFSNSDQRKKLNGIWVDKSADYLHPHLSNSLHIELPVFNHFPISELPYKRVVSHLPLRILEYLYAKFISKKNEFEGLNEVKSLLQKYNVDLDVSNIGARFMAQYYVALVLIKWYKPKKVFMAVPYMKMGYVYAFNSSGVTVVEMQHGTINSSHFGYCNYENLDVNLYPKYLLAYGLGVKDVFSNGNSTYKVQNVFNVGHYYLELISRSVNEIKEKHAKSFSSEINIGVSLQDDSIGQKIVGFLCEVAKLKSNWNIIFSPRKTPKEKYEKLGLPANISFIPELNVYEIIAASNIHSTVFSTCALEAPSLGTANVLCNIDGTSVKYFSNILGENSVTQYANTPHDFIEMVNRASFNSDEIKASNSKVINNNFNEGLETALKVILK